MPKISIIIPVYNVQKYLRQCLESVQKQSFTDFEVIVVDDGSPDESYKIYREFAEKDKRFRFIKKENGGVSRARNAGLESAKGDYVLFIDSDDWMALDACKVLYEKAQSSGADLTVADVYIAHENGKNEYVHIFDKEFVSSEQGFIHGYEKAVLAYAYNPRPYGGKCILPTGLGGPWNKLIKRELLDTWNIFFDPYVMGMFDDCLFTLHVLAHVTKVAYIDRPVYYYRMVESSLLHAYKKNMLEINSRIFERIEDFIDQYGDGEDLQEAYYFYIVRRFDESLGMYFFARRNPKQLQDKLREIKQIIGQVPYHDAFIGVQECQLNKSRRLICKAARANNAIQILLIYSLKQTKLKLKAKLQ